MSDIDINDLFYDDDGDFYKGSTQEYLEISDIYEHMKKLKKENNQLTQNFKQGCMHPEFNEDDERFQKHFMNNSFFNRAIHEGVDSVEMVYLLLNDLEEVNKKYMDFVINYPSPIIINEVVK